MSRKSEPEPIIQQINQHSPGKSSHPVSKTVENLVSEYSRLWWKCESSFPAFPTTYPIHQQQKNENELAQWIEKLSYALNHPPQSEGERIDWQEQLRSGLYEFARSTFSYDQHHLEFIESSGLIDASLEFARMARRFDGKISGEEIYQAGRNVMTSNFIQLLIGLPVEVTPAIFAYSMLYPYTDNYLDDTSVSPETKQSFNTRFQARLKGETVRLENPVEETIGRLVEMIEDQWDRNHFPLVYDSLLAIHIAQGRSLRLIQPDAPPYEIDVLGISFEKGGTSVLADGYLVAGSLTPQQARYLFGYGAFTQLMDDLEDAPGDIAAGLMTVFSQTALHWSIDRLTNRLFHFGRIILGDLDAFSSDARQPLEEVMRLGIDPIMIDIVGRVSQYFSKTYLNRIEKHSAYRLARLKRLRRKLNRKKITFNTLAAAINLHG